MSAHNVILMPKLGLTMTEGMLAEWAVKVGQSVQAGELMFVVETDKVATEIPAPSAGTVLEILVSQGQTVAVGTPVATWTGDGQPAGESSQSPDVETLNADALQRADDVHVSATSQTDSLRVVATPLARRLAYEAGVDVSKIRGTGPRGRIKAQDVRSAIDSHASQVATSTSRVLTDTRSEGLSSTRPPTSSNTGRSVAAGGIVQAMARRMVQAKQEVPHFYLSTEADVGELLALRKRLNEPVDTPKGPVKLTLNHFLIVAVAHALRRCPWQNRIWSGDSITAFDAVDIGIAVATDKGLMAPVLKGLDGEAIDTIANRANAMIDRVRTGGANRDDLTGGALTISNAGMYDVTYMTPIINPPQSGILGVGSVRGVFRPDDSGQPVLRHEMGLVLACDHRLHDGTSALRFLNVVVDLLENPFQLLRTIPAADSY